MSGAISIRNGAIKGALGMKLEGISLDVAPGKVLAVIGAIADGTALLCDLLATETRAARVTLEAPLPDGLRVDEVCALARQFRGEPPREAKDTLASLGIETLAKRRTASLAVDERRAVALAIALASEAELVIVEEPLANVAAASRVAASRIRERAARGAVVVTTASPRDATRIGDAIAVLVNGKLTAIEEGNMVSNDAGSLRVVVSAGRDAAATLVGALGRDGAVARVESAAFADGKATALHVYGDDLEALARAVTRAIAASNVNVDLIEPSIQPLDAIRAAVAAAAGAAR